MTARPGFLAEIAREVRETLRSGPPLDLSPPPHQGPRPGLAYAIGQERGRGALVAEFKRASPGQDPPELPPRTIAEFVRTTDVPGVVGYSCLATRPRFHGAPEDVAELVRATARPVLYKEFVLGPTQIDLAARTGARAVLLIARLEAAGLLEQPLGELAGHAHDLGLEVVLEFHQGAELRSAETVDADVYGVNVRDLDSLTLDPETALATLKDAAGQGLRPLLGLSGVAGPVEAQRFWDAGADGLLVGSALARAPDPGKFLASLRLPSLPRSA